MIELIAPDARYRDSWLEAAMEFDGAHRDGAGAEDLDLEQLRDPGVFEGFVERLLADVLPDSPRKPGYVPCTYLWIAQGDTILGSLAIRHELNDYLFNEGGHIGYSVRPSARRKGHATAALAQALPVAKALGISRVLVTCLEGNAGSRGTIEKNRGVYEDTRNGTRRYWIDAG